MAEDPVIEPKLESQDAETPTKINRKRRREFEERNAANPPLRTKKLRGALLAVHKPSHCLKNGVGSLQFADESLRFQHRVRLFRLLGQMLRWHNWAEASGVLSVLLKGTVKDRSISVNRTKYKVRMLVVCWTKWSNTSYSMCDSPLQFYQFSLKVCSF